MAERRTKLRHNHQPSDIDSDVVNVSDVPVHPTYRTNAELNLSVIRRHKPDVLSILSVAPFSVVYSFSPTTQQWEKRDVEGTLFVCHLLPSPDGADRYAVMVLNRRGLKNFTAELLNEGDVEITDQYVILQVANDDEAPQIIGLWIFEDTPTTRMLNAQIIQDCASQAESSRRAINEQRQDVREDERQEPHDEANGQLEEDDMDETLDPPQSEAMGRQVSLRELFGRQREQDDDWSMHNHTSPRPRPAPPAQSQFVPSPDTNFFRNMHRNAPPQPRQQHPQSQHLQTSTSQGGSQANILLDLFRNGKVGQQ